MQKPKLPPAARPETVLAAWPRWTLAAVAAVFVAAAFQIYSPALDGPFLFDDQRAVFADQEALARPDWHRFLLGGRPLLNALFWHEGRGWGEAPGPYHSLNALLHALNAVLVWRIVRRVLARIGLAGTAGLELPALAAAALFLVHPVQTESAAYIVSQSETLSAFCALSALLLFFPSGGAAGLGWGRAAGVLALFVAGVGFKEHIAALPAVLLLADLWFREAGMGAALKRNFRLYGLMAAGALAAGAVVWRVIVNNPTAGFGAAGVAPWPYLLTQGRVIWKYLFMLVWPAGQNLDHGYALVKGLDPPGIAGWLAIAAATWAAWRWRARFPAAGYGWLLFLLFLAPTSSIVPIADAMAERRLYLPFSGVALIVAEALARWRPPHAWQAAVAAILLALAAASYQRSGRYANPIAMWEDSVAKNPSNGRAHFQLGYAYYLEGRCAAASAEYERAAGLRAVDYDLVVDWALSLDCEGKPAEALLKLDQASKMERNAHAWALMGMVHGKQGRTEPALAALAEAEKINPRYAMIYVYRGNVLVGAGRPREAVAAFQKALELAPENEAARTGLQAARQAAATPAR